MSNITKNLHRRLLGFVLLLLGVLYILDFLHVRYICMFFEVTLLAIFSSFIFILLFCILYSLYSWCFTCLSHFWGSILCFWCCACRWLSLCSALCLFFEVLLLAVFSFFLCLSCCLFFCVFLCIFYFLLVVVCIIALFLFFSHHFRFLFFYSSFCYLCIAFCLFSSVTFCYFFFLLFSFFSIDWMSLNKLQTYTHTSNILFLLCLTVSVYTCLPAWLNLAQCDCFSVHHLVSASAHVWRQWRGWEALIKLTASTELWALFSLLVSSWVS